LPPASASDPSPASLVASTCSYFAQQSTVFSRISLIFSKRRRLEAASALASYP
jgi:hypothetical protein